MLIVFRRLQDMAFWENIVKFLKKNCKRRIVNSDKYLVEKMVVAPFVNESSSELYDIFMNNTENNLFKWHHYFPIYEKHFSRYRNKPVNVLEIGVALGGSMKMWKKYFGENANIYGVDIHPGCKKFEDPDNAIHVYIGDQDSPEFLRDLMDKLPQIDILIDDGGHTTSQQITTFLECYDKISDDGVYLCEDLHTNYDDNYVNTSETFIDFAKNHIDSLTDSFMKTNSPVFTNITQSISFYNSIIVFEKQKTCMSLAEIK